ncbi:histidine kinase dimerization/phosphoacceptor domain-containing protein [Yinghuangia aomiensis]
MDHGQPGGGSAPDASRPRPAPRPPLLRRMPAAVRTAAAGGMAAAYALLVFTTLPLHGTPNMPPHRFVAYPWELRVGVAVVMAAPLVLVRRRPEIALGLLLVLSVGAWLYLARSWPPFVAATVIVGRLAANRPRRTGIAAACALAGVWVAEITLGWVLFPHGNTRISDVLSMASAALLMAAVAWTAGNSVRQSRAYSAALHAEAATRMVVAERLRIARELHDSVAHSMGIIAIQAGAARRVIDTQPENARQALGTIETTSREALAGMRRMLGRSAVPRPNRPRPLRPQASPTWTAWRRRPPPPACASRCGGTAGPARCRRKSTRRRTGSSRNRSRTWSGMRAARTAV